MEPEVRHGGEYAACGAARIREGYEGMSSVGVMRKWVRSDKVMVGDDAFRRGLMRPVVEGG
jgi:hypothetical protein